MINNQQELSAGAGEAQTDMTHPSADVSVVSVARVIAPGMAVLPPLERMLFWLGPIAEQAMVVNVRGFGLVLVTGCGHPRIERTLAACELALDLPMRAVVGGLHLPVHPLGTPLLPQALCSATRTGPGDPSAKPTRGPRST